VPQIATFTGHSLKDVKPSLMRTISVAMRGLPSGCSEARSENKSVKDSLKCGSLRGPKSVSV